MDNNKKKHVKGNIKENINVELGGIQLYGTTSNEEIAGYRSSGNIENAGQLDKGFERPEGEAGAVASVKNEKD